MNKKPLKKIEVINLLKSIKKIKNKTETIDLFKSNNRILAETIISKQVLESRDKSSTSNGCRIKVYEFSNLLILNREFNFPLEFVRVKIVKEINFYIIKLII